MAKSSFTLDDINEASEKEYGSTEIGPLPDGTMVELRNAIRLSKEERKTLKNFKFSDEEQKDEDGNVIKVEKDDDSDDDDLEKIAEFLKIVAADKSSVDKLIQAIGPNRPDLLLLIIRNYTEDQKTGKASESES